jgi:hypothetical protein
MRIDVEHCGHVCASERVVEGAGVGNRYRVAAPPGEHKRRRQGIDPAARVEGGENDQSVKRTAP